MTPFFCSHRICADGCLKPVRSASSFASRKRFIPLSYGSWHIVGLEALKGLNAKSALSFHLRRCLSSDSAHSIVIIESGTNLGQAIIPDDCLCRRCFLHALRSHDMSVP